MIKIGLGFGSNMGDKAGNIARAVALLQESSVIHDLRLSSLYRTAPWGNENQDWFVNACALAQTSLGAEALLDLVQRVELEMGRERIERWGPRNIDVDVLFYGDTRLETPRLTLPHVELLNRAFVLVPLLELEPNLMIGTGSARTALEKLDARDVIKLPS